MSIKPRRAVYAMSRKQRQVLTILFLLAAAFIVWFDHNRPNQSTKQTSAQQQSLSDFDFYNGKYFQVIKVVDGDTLYLNIPDGNDSRTIVRLWGVDTPETKDPRTSVMYFGPQASEFTKRFALGKDVRVFLDSKQSRDKYDRILAYIQLPDGQFLNELLLSEGYAYADVRFKHSYYQKYQQLQAAAKRNKKGLWANIKFDELPKWLQRERPNVLAK